MANFNVNNTESLEAALASADNNINITITGDFKLTKQMVIPTGKTVNITNPIGYHNITRDFTGDMFVVKSGATLSVTGIRLDGNRSEYPDGGGSIIKAESGAKLNIDADLINNVNKNGNGGAISIPHDDLANLNVSKNSAFLNNKAATNTKIIKQSDVPVHDAHIHAGVFSEPHDIFDTQPQYGYNNDDISYVWKSQNNYNFGDKTDGTGNSDPQNAIYKTLSDGGEFINEQFYFYVKDDKGNQYAAGHNDDDGNVIVNADPFTTPGVYRYYVAEDEYHQPENYEIDRLFPKVSGFNLFPILT